MTNVITSASKIVFILIAIAVIVGLFVGKVDPKDFITLATMVFVFYYTKPSSPTTAGVATF
jgi:hypothetical protein